MLPAQPSRSRRAYDAATGTFREFAVHSWASLGSGAAIEAPALIEMIGTTCVLTNPYRCAIDSERNLVLTSRPS